MKEKNNIHLSQTYPASASKIFDLIKTGVLFELTGANEIHFDFWEGGIFRLLFNNRGEISGTVLKIIPDEQIILSWNVDGFNKEPEHDTKVTISILENETTTVSIEHIGVKMHDTSLAKKKAWTEILEDLSMLIEKEAIES